MIGKAGSGLGELRNHLGTLVRIDDGGIIFLGFRIDLLDDLIGVTQFAPIDGFDGSIRIDGFESIGYRFEVLNFISITKRIDSNDIDVKLGVSDRYELAKQGSIRSHPFLIDSNSTPDHRFEARLPIIDSK